MLSGDNGGLVAASEGHEIGPGTVPGFVPLPERGVSEAKRRFGRSTPDGSYLVRYKPHASASL
jgi:hypothetical protein